MYTLYKNYNNDDSIVSTNFTAIVQLLLMSLKNSLQITISLKCDDVVLSSKSYNLIVIAYLKIKINSLCFFLIIHKGDISIANDITLAKLYTLTNNSEKIVQKCSVSNVEKSICKVISSYNDYFMSDCLYVDNDSCITNAKFNNSNYDMKSLEDYLFKKTYKVIDNGSSMRVYIVDGMHMDSLFFFIRNNYLFLNLECGLGNKRTGKIKFSRIEDFHNFLFNSNIQDGLDSDSAYIDDIISIDIYPSLN